MRGEEPLTLSQGLYVASRCGYCVVRIEKRTNLLVAEDFLDIVQCLSTPDHEAVLDWQSHRASNPLALSNVGGTQQIISFGHDSKYTVLLWQQCELYRGTDAVEDV